MTPLKDKRRKQVCTGHRRTVYHLLVWDIPVAKSSTDFCKI